MIKLNNTVTAVKKDRRASGERRVGEGRESACKCEVEEGRERGEDGGETDSLTDRGREQ